MRRGDDANEDREDRGIRGLPGERLAEDDVPTRATCFIAAPPSREGRGPAAGRDVDIPRASRRRERSRSPPPSLPTELGETKTVFDDFCGVGNAGVVLFMDFTK